MAVDNWYKFDDNNRSEPILNVLDAIKSSSYFIRLLLLKKVAPT